MKNVWYSTLIDLGCVNSRTSSVMFRFSRVKVCGGGDAWALLRGEVLDRIGNGYRLCMLGDLNG